MCCPQVATGGEAQNVDKSHQEIEGESTPTTEEVKEDVHEAHLTELQEEPKLEDLSNEELGRVIAARWTGEDTTVHVPEEHQDHLSADELHKHQDNEADNDSDMEPEHDYNEDDEYILDKEEEQVPETRRVS